VAGRSMRRSGLQRIWTYLYSTANSPLLEEDAVASGPVAGRCRLTL